MTKVSFADWGDNYLPCWRRRPGEAKPLLAFLALNLLTGTATFAYGNDAKIIAAEDRGELIRFVLYPAVRGSFFPTIVRKVRPLLQIMLDGYLGTVVDGDNDAIFHVVLDEAGKAADREIDDWLDELIYKDKDPLVFAAIWQPADYIRDRVIPGGGITAATSDDRLDHIEDECRDAAESEGIHIDGDLLPELRALRDRLRETAPPLSGPTAPPDVEP